MAFIKGQSGNANGGRVKSVEQREFEAKCRQWCSEFAFSELSKRALGKDEKRSDWALEAILNRAFGKAVETSVIEANVTAQVGSPAQTLADELAAIVPGTAIEGPGSDSQAALDGGK